MTGIEIIGLVISILTLIGGVEMRVKSITKHYLEELKPNSGSSMRDEIKEIKSQVETILKIINKNI